MIPLVPPIRAAPLPPPIMIVRTATRLSWYLDSIIDLLSPDTANGHHPGLVMVSDVAMEHPVAAVIGDEGDLGSFACGHQHRIPPLPKLVRFAVPADDAKAMPV